MRVGIDLGGTKISTICMSDDGAVLQQHRVATPSKYKDLVAVLVELIHNLESFAKAQGTCITTVGIGTPGSISHRSGAMKNSNSSCLNGQYLQQDLEAVLDCSIHQANDADCLALSESTDGAAKDYSSVFAVILGTGVGGGLVFNRQLVTGPNGIAGEWGHNPLVSIPGYPILVDRKCYCGQWNCIETFLCGAGLQQTYLELSGERFSTEAIVEGYQKKDPDCVAAIDRYARQLAASVSVVINVFDPAAVVLGGGLSNISALYPLVTDYWRRTIFSDDVLTQLLPPCHGDDSGVRGAAWL